MNGLSEVWPFVPGQQELIFAFTGAVIVGLISLNVLSGIRQGLPIRKLLSGLFVEVGTGSTAEEYARLVLLVLFVAGFIVLVIDTQVNGMQLINPEVFGK